MKREIKIWEYSCDFEGCEKKWRAAKPPKLTLCVPPLEREIDACEECWVKAAAGKLGPADLASISDDPA